MNLELELNDEELLSARMPRLVLQPLVENVCPAWKKRQEREP